jgi:hypothetical protein
MNSNIKFFKLTYSGNFIELSSDNELDYFNLFDIIAVFVANQKRMYVWIAKKASQSLKSHIPQIRRIFSKEYPELVILRNITIDAGSEPSEFFDFMDFSREDLDTHLRNIETKLLPIVSEINRLKNDADRYFISEDFEKAIYQAEKIISLAKKIEDESLESDQIDFINEARIKAKAKKRLKEIEDECEEIIEEFEKRIEVDDFRGAHNVVNGFKMKYEDEFDLLSIPLAKHIILMDNNLIENINKETNRIKEILTDLQRKFERSLFNEDLSMMLKILNQARELVGQVSDKTLDHSIELLSDKYLKKKDEIKTSIIKMTQKANLELEERDVTEAMKIYENIVNKLKNALKEYNLRI